jgi:2,5-diketo-D-gluconate reductase A
MAHVTAGDHPPVAAITLNDGNRIPQLGIGLAIPLRETMSVILHAVNAGYRMLDTAATYRTEVGVRNAIERSSVSRAGMFITTKLSKHGRDAALRSFEASLKRLGSDYVDLYLIHYPFPDQNRYVETWKALTGLKSDGRARSIGVSNFTIEQLERIVDATGVVPAINQIGVHPRLQRTDLRRFHSQLGIVTEAYSPLGSGQAVQEPGIQDLAARYERTPAQIVLRWHVELGNVAIPRSLTPARLEENLRIFDFELADEDVRAISSLDVGDLDRDPSTFPSRTGAVGAITDFAERHPVIDPLIQSAKRARSLSSALRGRS